MLIILAASVVALFVLSPAAREAVLEGIRAIKK